MRLFRFNPSFKNQLCAKKREEEKMKSKNVARILIGNYFVCMCCYSLYLGLLEKKGKCVCLFVCM